VHCHDEFVMCQTGHYGNSHRRFQYKRREKIDFHIDSWEQFQHENSTDNGIRLVNFTTSVNVIVKSSCSRLEHSNTL
jgi:hypothetical protein